MQHKWSRIKRRFPRLRRQRAFEFIEILVSLCLLSVLFVVLMTVQGVLAVQSSSYNKVVARQLLVEESEALRNASYATLTELTDRTNQPFMDVAYNAGSWKIDALGDSCPAPCSGGNAMHVSGVSGTSNPSRAVVPAGWLGDGKYDLYFRPRNTSSDGWGAGMYLRYRDDKNYFLLQATANTLGFIRKSSGDTVSLWSANQTLTPNTWHQLTVVAEGLAFTISLDGTSLTTVADAIPVGEPPLDIGQFVLNAANGVVADFDDVTFTNAMSVPTTLAWNFDGSNETTGMPAHGWRRLGPDDLPAGTTSLTISDAQSGFTDLKKAILAVSWFERNATRTYTNTFYINQRSVPQ